jgi:hypothetical protein
MRFIGRHATAALAPMLAIVTLFTAIGFAASNREPSEGGAGVVQADARPLVEEFENPAALSGREIYKRLLANKYRRGVQKLKIISSDPGGSEQTTVFEASLEDHRDETGDPVDGLNASVLIEVSSPFDMRHTTYLMVSKEPGPDDEFIYQPSNRRVRRVDLKRTPLLGTDYTFDDLAYHDLDGATYKRLPDEVFQGVPVFVVEAIVTDARSSVAHRSVSYVEQEHYVPVRIRYWDEYAVEIKEMTVEVDSIEVFHTTWVARRSQMKDLLQRTKSKSTVLELDAHPNFSPMFFSVRRLSQGR